MCKQIDTYRLIKIRPHVNRNGQLLNKLNIHKDCKFGKKLSLELLIINHYSAVTSVILNINSFL